VVHGKSSWSLYPGAHGWGGYHPGWGRDVTTIVHASGCCSYLPPHLFRSPGVKMSGCFALQP